MRKWPRRILKGVLLVCLCAVAAGWVRSYFASDFVQLQQNNLGSPTEVRDLSRSIFFDSGSGAFFIVWEHMEFLPNPSTGKKQSLWPNWVFRKHASSPARVPILQTGSSGWRNYWRGFGVGREIYASAYVPSIALFVQMPFWTPFLLLGVLNAAWLTRWIRKRRRFAVGHCIHCGYDLRASPERCPECGSAVVGT